VTKQSHAKLCPIPVFVEEGFPFGQCLREKGHAGLCDVYDGRPDPLPPMKAPTKDCPIR
jgi:hypothetical protein